MAGTKQTGRKSGKQPAGKQQMKKSVDKGKGPAQPNKPWSTIKTKGKQQTGPVLAIRNTVGSGKLRH